MTNREYESIQSALSRLIDDEHKRRYAGSSRHWGDYKEAVLKCKSVLKTYKPKENEE